MLTIAARGQHTRGRPALDALLSLSPVIGGSLFPVPPLKKKNYLSISILFFPPQTNVSVFNVCLFYFHASLKNVSCCRLLLFLIHLKR